MRRVTVVRIVECPDSGCRLPAEVLGTWEFASTAGPMRHMKTRCVGEHIFTVPAHVCPPVSYRGGLR